MSDTKALIKYVRDRLNDGPNITFGKPTVCDLVEALEQAEVTAEIINSMMAGITGKKESVRVEVDGFQCPYCNERSKTIEAATAHDAICPKHPAVMRAERAEANVARLTKMANWLVSQSVFRGVCPKGADKITCGLKHCETCWKEAARRAVADTDGEVKG